MITRSGRGIIHRWGYRAVSQSTLSQLQRQNGETKAVPQYRIFSGFSTSSKDKQKKEEEILEKTAWIPPTHALGGNKGNYYEEEEGKVDGAKKEEDDDDSFEFVDISNYLKTKKGTVEAQEFDPGIVELDGDDIEDDELAFMQKLYEMEEDLEQDDEEWDEEQIQREIQKLEKEYMQELNDEELESSPSEDIPDWSHTRRSRFKALHSNPNSPTAFPDVKPYTLLTSREIMECLTSLGARDVVLIQPTPTLQVDGMIVATCHTPAHNRSMGEVLVSSLRERKLQERGVVGASLGAEDDDENWICVDCGNYFVHLQDELTRRSVDLERLWDPALNAKKRRQIEEMRILESEERVEEFVERNPVPEEYLQRLWEDGQREDVMESLGRMKWHQGSILPNTKRRKSRSGSKKKKARNKKYKR